MRQLSNPSGLGLRVVGKVSPIRGALLLGLSWLACLGLAGTGCVFDDSAVDAPDPFPIPQPEPEPVPEPLPVDCNDPVPFWIDVEVVRAPDGWLDPQVTITNCTTDPLYVYADGCFGTVVRLERLEDDGSISEVGPLWACAWGGPTNPSIVEPVSALTLSNEVWGGLMENSPGRYRFVYWVTYDFTCPDAPPPGGPWDCAADQPWEELATDFFAAP